MLHVNIETLIKIRTAKKRQIMRLDKTVASVSDLSRSDAKKAIRAGRVTVADKLQREPKFNVDESTAICLDGAELRRVGHRYIMLNKPQGYICATKDRQHLTVLQLLDEDNCEQMHIAGRLDIDTTGLVLITDDGKWSHGITSPRRDCRKTYLVETADPISIEAVSKIESGIHLDGEKKSTLPATLEIIDEHSARLTISEGKYHQVKRMFAAVGNKVELLHRESIGSLTLDEDLLPGEYRHLSSEEVSML